MKRRKILELGSLSLAGLMSSGYSQKQSQYITRLFNTASSQHKREFESMRNSRAAPSSPVLWDATAESVSGALSQGYKDSYPEGTAVLFYSYSDSSLQTWLLSEHGIQGYQKQSITKSKISEAISSLRHSLNVDDFQRSRSPHKRGGLAAATPGSRTQPLDAAIAHLTSLLLPTLIANQLKPVTHLIVVPILEIGTAPYAILKPFDDSSFLIEKMSISIAPNLFDLERIIEPWYFHDLFRAPLVVGDPYLPQHPDWFVPPLPGASSEAQSITAAINTASERADAIPLIGRDATKLEVLSRFRHASLLYFATHGVANSLDPLAGGFLMLSAETLEQGWWTAQEIQSTQCSAQIAVLSACQTGLGQTHDAGIVGLSRAFQIAGVPRVVMSLWNVDDQSTGELMQLFFKHLGTTFPSEALRQAMLETKEKYPDLSKWASFVMFGTPR